MAIILIVDDDPTVRLIAGDLLRREDHAIVEAEDGDEALKVVASMAVDLVVLDMLMPNRDGLETIVELRRHNPGIRILAISSGGQMERGILLHTAMIFGADRSLEKPLRPGTFAEVVNSLLAAPSQAVPPMITLSAGRAVR